ncbi:ETC complex I subunit [Pelagibacteraceae bacterium]|nr:ETC complex I subunit [Pelagibacteraceae bacterium]
MQAKIYKPAKTAMQSGRAKYNKWILKISDSKNQTKDTMMGWNGGSDTRSQIQLQFKTKEDAINYAKSNNLDYEVLETSERKVISKSYADNFK